MAEDQDKRKQKKKKGWVPRAKRTAVRLLLLAAVALFCFVCGMWSAGKGDQGPAITSDLISSRIEEVSRLAVTEYRYTKVGKYENRLDFYGWEVPLTLKRFIISYDGTVTAGVDLTRAQVKTEGTNRIQIVLPQAEILSHEIDLESITVFDETKNIFNPIQITDYVEFSKDQKEGAEQEAVEKGLLSEAGNRACEVVEQWLEVMYGSSEDGGPEISVTIEK